MALLFDELLLNLQGNFKDTRFFVDFEVLIAGNGVSLLLITAFCFTIFSVFIEVDFVLLVA